MNLKTSIQATEITDVTERKCVSHISSIFHVHLMGAIEINVNTLFFSVDSVISVANRFSSMIGVRA